MKDSIHLAKTYLMVKNVIFGENLEVKGLITDC